MGVIAYLCGMLALLPACDSEGYCSFPPFLWQSETENSPRIWLSKTEYVGNSQTWAKQKEINVYQTEISIRHNIHASCNGYRPQADSPCVRQSIDYHLICISEEPNDKYRVRQTVHGKYSFTCLQFIQRTSHIIQVYSAVPNELNEDRLCHDTALQRDEWPWYRPVRGDETASPITGGFDFFTFIGSSRQKQCADEWRPSRIESECISGEGVDFFFPTIECSPFFMQPTIQSLQCLGHWEEDGYMFVVLAESDQLPRYILRMQKDSTTRDDTAAMSTWFLYFSLVLPMSGHGTPPGQVLHLEIKANKSGSGVCYDVGDQCQAFAQEGRCTSSAPHQYPSYCKKSCGLCELAPSSRRECIFPQDVQGKWTMFTSTGMEHIVIRDGVIAITGRGDFVCKGKHWQYDFYKLFSHYTNGCRPRYSCVHLHKRADGRLNFRLSQSVLSDESFEICTFHDNSQSHGDVFSNGAKKMLIPSSAVQHNSCVLGGVLVVNATFGNGRTCSGTLTDVHKITCQVRNRFSLDLPSCEESTPRDFQCSAMTLLPNKERFILTHLSSARDKQTYGVYWCWVVHFPWLADRSATFPVMYSIHRARCGDGQLLSSTDLPNQLLAVQRIETSKEQFCNKGFLSSTSQTTAGGSTNAPVSISLSLPHSLTSGSSPTSPVKPDRRSNPEYQVKDAQWLSDNGARSCADYDIKHTIVWYCPAYICLALLTYILISPR